MHGQTQHGQVQSSQLSPTAFRAGSTGQSFTSGQTGGLPGPVPGAMSAGPTGQPQFPDITTFLATKYGNTFKSANKDQSGDIPGGEVLRLLGSVPVDVAVKKEAWDLVAGATRLPRIDRMLYHTLSVQSAMPYFVILRGDSACDFTLPADVCVQHERCRRSG